MRANRRKDHDRQTPLVHQDIRRGRRGARRRAVFLAERGLGRRHRQGRRDLRPVRRPAAVRQEPVGLRRNGDRRDQRRRRRPRQEARGQDLRLAVPDAGLQPVRKADGAARPGGGGPGRADQLVPRGDPADPAQAQDPLLLQHQLRGRGVRPQLLRHRRDARRLCRPSVRRGDEALGQECLHHGRGLQLRPDHRQVDPEGGQGRRRQGGGRGVLPADRQPVRPDHQQDPGGQARFRDERLRRARRMPRSMASGRRPA